MFFTELLSGLSPAPTPVKLTVTTTQQERQRRLSLFRKAAKPNLDSQGLQELLTTLHTSHGKAATFDDQEQGGHKRRFVLSLCGGGGAVVLVLLLVGWLNSARGEWLNLPCDSIQCRYYAQFLDDAANTSVDPCSDFHTRICSRWASRNRLPVKETVLDELVCMRVRPPFRRQYTFGIWPEDPRVLRT